MNEINEKTLRIQELEDDFAKIASENKKIIASKTCFFYLLKECILTIKKKKNSLGNALRMIEDENDYQEIKKILKKFNIKYK